MMNHKQKYQDLFYISLFIAIGIIIGSGCSDPNSSKVEGKVVYDRIEVIESPTAPPTDNPLASVWDGVPTGAITIGDTSLGYPGDFGKKTVTIKAIKTAGKLYVRAEWLDVIRDVWPNRIYHKQDTTKDTSGNITDIDSTWLRYNTVDTIIVRDSYGNITDTVYHWYDQDRLAIMWDIGNNGTEKADCKSMCHIVGSDTTKYTTGGGIIDLWHWKAATSDPLYLAEDEFWGADGRHTDTSAQELITVNFDSTNLRPLYSHFDSTKFNKPFLYSSEAVTYSQTAPWPRGYIMPGYVLSNSVVPPASDIYAFSSYLAGSAITARWVVMLSRDLSTGHGDDVDLSAIAPGDSVMATIAIMDNSNKLHSGSKPIYFVFP